MQKTITKTIILLAVLTLALSVNYIFAAWVGPTQAPPGGNTPTPVHVGTTNQVKDGGLSLESLAVFGDGYFQGTVQVGNSGIDPQAGMIRWTGSDLEVYTGTEWKSLTAESSSTTIISGDSVDCTNVGGNWVDTQGICYVPGTSCPADWTAEENFSTTLNNSCNSSTAGAQCSNSYTQCSTGGHVRVNQGIESCTFYNDFPSGDGNCLGGEIVNCIATQTEIGCVKKSTVCSDAGGDWQDSQDICYFSGTSCASGWSPNANYSSTNSNSCYGEYGTDCVTGQHYRQSIPVENCETWDGYNWIGCSASVNEIGCTI